MVSKEIKEQVINRADIIDVVSDFTHLKDNGNGFVGFCPFHNDETPTLVAHRETGLCVCNRCKKGGSPINFIMELCGFSYDGAIRFLAKKYGITIDVDSNEDSKSVSEFQFHSNQYVKDYYINNLFNTEEGRSIGISYFYERGFTIETIKKFQLGYSLEFSKVYADALSNSIRGKDLIDTGVCFENSRGGFIDRFRGRVIFPVHNVIGDIVAFGGRTLKHDSAKYVNSPESHIYKKSNELYGIYFAKESIVAENACFLVEGYTDVISMHQAGITNVIASSGTSLTEGQIRLIRRFTENVTVLYDGDAAGIHASIRGIDMLLAAGLNVSVLLLPDGEDPDSYSKNHTREEVLSYIKKNKCDFIQFKLQLLLKDTNNDISKRDAVITDILNSISVIPSSISRFKYIKECSRLLNFPESKLLVSLKKIIISNTEKNFNKNQIKQTQGEQKVEGEAPLTFDFSSIVGSLIKDDNKILNQFERTIIRYIIKYAFCEIEIASQTGYRKEFVVDYITNELNSDYIILTNKFYAQILNIAQSLKTEFIRDYAIYEREQEDLLDSKFNQETQNLVNQGLDIAKIQEKEATIKNNLATELKNALTSYSCLYSEQHFCSHIDSEIRNIAIDLAFEKHKISKIHSQSAVIQSEYDRLGLLIQDALANLKHAIIACEIKRCQQQIKTATDQEISEILVKQQKLLETRAILSKYLGDRVVNPKI